MRSMEPNKLQTSKLFTHAPIDFRDKIEEVNEKFKFFSAIFPAIFLVFAKSAMF